MPRFVRRSLLVAAVAVLAVPALLAAHVVLRASDPADGARLAASPSALRLSFSQRTELALTRVVLADSAGSELAIGAPARDPADTAGITVSIPGRLRPGSYTVAWRTAAPDGHLVSGQFAFAVGSAATGTQAAAQQPPEPHQLVGLEPPRAVASTRARVVNRWVEFMALLTVIGTVTLVLAVLPRAAWPDDLLSRVTDGARRFGMGALLLLGAAMLTRLVAESMTAFGEEEGFGMAALGTIVTETRWGTGWMIGAAGVATAAVGLTIARRARAGWFVAALGVAAAAASPALTGHAIAAGSRIGVAADVAHVLGAGVWLGTLLVIVFAVLPPMMSRADAGRAPDSAGETLLAAFHRVALQGVVLVVATGVIGAVLRLGAVGTLWETRYGQVLLLKLAAVAVVAGLGMYHWKRVVPASWSGDTAFGFRRSALVELAVAAIVLALTAVLVGTPTPAGS